MILIQLIQCVKMYTGDIDIGGLNLLTDINLFSWIMLFLVMNNQIVNKRCRYVLIY